MNKQPKRGDVYLVCLDAKVTRKISKVRPAVIISNDIGNSVSLFVTVIPVTSYKEKIYPFEALLFSENSGLSHNSIAKCNQVRTIAKKRLVRSIGKISAEEIGAIEEALLIHSGMYFDRKN